MGEAVDPAFIHSTRGALEERAYKLLGQKCKEWDGYDKLLLTPESLIRISMAHTVLVVHDLAMADEFSGVNVSSFVTDTYTGTMPEVRMFQAQARGSYFLGLLMG